MMRRSPIRALWGLWLLFYFLYLLVKANAIVAWEVVTPGHYMKPGIIKVPLQSKTALEVSALAILITLTPGTLFLEASDDFSVCFIHGLHVHSPDTFRVKVGQLEAILLKAMR